MNLVFDRIKKIGSKIDATDLRIIKLGEEFGEFCESYLQLIGFKKSKGKTKEELNDHFLEEGVDAYIMVMDILASRGFSKKDIIDKTHEKLDKWEKDL